MLWILNAPQSSTQCRSPAARVVGRPEAGRLAPGIPVACNLSCSCSSPCMPLSAVVYARVNNRSGDGCCAGSELHATRTSGLLRAAGQVPLIALGPGLQEGCQGCGVGIVGILRRRARRRIRVHRVVFGCCVRVSFLPPPLPLYPDPDTPASATSFASSTSTSGVNKDVAPAAFQLRLHLAHVPCIADVSWALYHGGRGRVDTDVGRVHAFGRDGGVPHQEEQEKVQQVQKGPHAQSLV
jgi:hypothetical protein